jgi:integrase
MLRHTFGTECARRGVPVRTIKEWMGHTKIDTTMVYLHLVAPDHLRWAELMEEQFWRREGGRSERVPKRA